MWFIKNNKRKKEMEQKQPTPKARKDTLGDLYEMLSESEDFISGTHKLKKLTVYISYIKPMVDNETVHRDIMPYLINADAETLKELVDALPYTTAILTKDIKQIKENIFKGFIFIQLKKNDPHGILLNAVAKNGRSVTPAEVETSVMGPKESFIESLDTNISLVRKRLPLPNFKVHNITIGKITKTKVAVLFIPRHNHQMR